MGKPNCNSARSASRRPSVSSVRKDASRPCGAFLGSIVAWRLTLAAAHPDHCFETPSKPTSLEIVFITVSTPACQRSSSWNCSRRRWLGMPAATLAARPEAGLPVFPKVVGPLRSSEAACDLAVLGPVLRAERGVRHGDLLCSGRSAGIMPRGGRRPSPPETAEEPAAGPEAAKQPSRSSSRDCKP